MFIENYEKCICSDTHHGLIFMLRDARIWDMYPMPRRREYYYTHNREITPYIRSSIHV